MDPKVQHIDGKQLVNDVKLSIEKMLQKKVMAVRVNCLFFNIDIACS